LAQRDWFLADAAKADVVVIGVTNRIVVVGIQLESVESGLLTLDAIAAAVAAATGLTGSVFRECGARG
jgi:hypothetical protein